MKPYYSDERAKIYHADCRDILPSIDASEIVVLVTDPPYGIDHKTHGQVFRNASPIAGDQDLVSADFVNSWAEARRAPTVMFFSPYRPLVGFRNVLVWSKGEHVGIGGDRETCWKRDFEMIGVTRNGPLRGKRESGVLFFPALLPPPSGHFAEKPVALMAYLIGKIGGRGTVIDPFCGSGSTLVAASDLGRRSIGVELDERWCEVAARRLANRTASLFPGAE